MAHLRNDCVSRTQRCLRLYLAIKIWCFDITEYRTDTHYKKIEETIYLSVSQVEIFAIIFFVFFLTFSEILVLNVKQK